jgi:hypothetical protein
MQRQGVSTGARGGAIVNVCTRCGMYFRGCPMVEPAASDGR